MRRYLVAWAVAILAGGLATACGEDAPGQERAERTIGILRAVRSLEGAENQAAFLDELRRAGLVEGRNLRLLGRDLDEVHADPAEAEAVVRDWARGPLDLVVALSSSGAMAAARGAPDTNVLFLSNDPTATGLLRDERAPEGRLTGATFRVPADRTLELARRLVPGAGRIGFLYPSEDPSAVPVRAGTLEAARQLRIDLVDRAFATAADIAPAFDDLRAEGAAVVMIANAPTSARNFAAIRDAAAAAGLPAVTNTAADFALAVLEPDVRELYRQMARQAVRLLEGAPTSAVPVEDPARFRFILDLRVAARMGIEVPSALVASADVVLRP
ncbi:MAG: ABC transporter substrate-binding protein [Acidimicrobiia bacterium]